ncbi:hypothetical protein L596_030907 [Steinernema carpocapsae]|uniref:Uncharacterized protein n=1 Tax=Steinernema carpocapsae TaxID=34508 RepID=A0A4U5MH99_STECR|nr:hypothetical protein L596_030907 [Steinernema carpocapsae]
MLKIVSQQKKTVNQKKETVHSTMRHTPTFQFSNAFFLNPKCALTAEILQDYYTPKALTVCQISKHLKLMIPQKRVPLSKDVRFTKTHKADKLKQEL